MPLCGTLWKKNISDEDAKRFAPTIILGPFPFAIYALIVVTFGQIIVNSTRQPGTGADFYPGWVCFSQADDDLDDTLMGNLFGMLWMPNIWICYAILLTFIWSFIGFRLEFNLNRFMTNAPERLVPLVLPFTELRWLAGIYLVLFIFHFLAMIMGSIALALAARCNADNLAIFSFSSFMVAMYWLLFGLLSVRQCGRMFGAKLEAGLVRAAKRATTKQNPELLFVAEKFKKFDAQGDGQMDSAELGALMAAINVDVGEEELDEIETELDADASGTINLKEFLQWYVDNYGKGAGEDDDEDDDDEGERTPLKGKKDKGKWGMGMNSKKTKQKASDSDEDGSDESDDEDDTDD